MSSAEGTEGRVDEKEDSETYCMCEGEPESVIHHSLDGIDSEGIVSFPDRPPIGGKGGLVTLVDFLGTVSTIWEGPITLQDIACRANVM